MSCTLYWRPLTKGNSVGGTQLRQAIERRFGREARLDIDALEFLRGLEAGGVEGATELIEAIEKHEEIDVYQEC